MARSAQTAGRSAGLIHKGNIIKTDSGNEATLTSLTDESDIGALSPLSKPIVPNLGERVKPKSEAVFRGIGKATIDNDAPGLVRSKHTSTWSDSLAKAVDTTARALGVKVVVDETITTPSGQKGGGSGYYENGVIHIAADAVDPVLTVQVHELTHRMQVLAPEVYRVFRDYAVKLEGAQTVEDTQRFYGENGVKLSNEAAADEAAARLAQRLFTDEAAMTKLATENRSLAQKIFDYLKDMIQMVKERIGFAEPTLEEARRKWERAFQSAKEAAQRKTTGQIADGGRKYAIRHDKNGAIAVLEEHVDSERSAVLSFLKGLVSEEPFSTVLSDAQEIYIGKDFPGEYTQSEYTKNLFRTLKNAKFQAAYIINDMLLIGDNVKWGKDKDGKHGAKAKNGWYYYTTRFAVPVFNQRGDIDHYNPYTATLLVRNDANGRSYLYDITKIQKESSALPVNGFTDTNIYSRAPSAN